MTTDGTWVRRNGRAASGRSQETTWNAPREIRLLRPTGRFAPRRSCGTCEFETKGLIFIFRVTPGFTLRFTPQWSEVSIMLVPSVNLQLALNANTYDQTISNTKNDNKIISLALRWVKTLVSLLSARRALIWIPV